MAELFLSILYVFNVSPGAFIPGMQVTFIDAVDLAARRRPDVFMGEKKLTETRIECESIHAMTGRVHHHRTRAINEVSSGNLVYTFLQTIFNASVRRVVRDSPMNREYGSDT